MCKPDGGKMEISEYADWTEETWVDGASAAVALAGLGLAGETGEVVELLKKHLRDGGIDTDKLALELGDVLYYWARVCKEYGLDPLDVIGRNVEKLTSRKARGVISGTGGDR